MNQPVLSSPQFMTMAEYLVYEDDTDKRYELVDGVLIEMPTESQINASIAKFLLFELAKHCPIALLAYNTELEVPSKRVTCRVPDLLVHTKESAAALASTKCNVITSDMPAPALVVEVVSPGQKNRDRDYRYKHTEYAARGIPEYWIIDPDMQQVTLCLWVNGQYEDKIYTGNTPLNSTVMPAFKLSASQILAFGQPETGC